MGLPARLVRSQLNFFKPFVANCSLEVTRKGQDKLGELMEAIHKKDVIVRDYSFERFEGAWLIPRDERRSGVSVKPGQVIGVRERSKSLEVIANSLAGFNHSKYPWLEWDDNAKVGKLLHIPERADIPENIKEHLIVELYSK